jgi:hypothetical protein
MATPVIAGSVRCPPLARPSHRCVLTPIYSTDIRTYAVVPLNEDCGLIEWVPHVVVLRGILNKSYQARGIAPWVGAAFSSLSTSSLLTHPDFPQGPELKRVFDTIRDDPKKTGDRFVNEVLKRCACRSPGSSDSRSSSFPSPTATRPSSTSGSSRTSPSLRHGFELVWPTLARLPSSPWSASSSGESWSPSAPSYLTLAHPLTSLVPPFADSATVTARTFSWMARRATRSTSTSTVSSIEVAPLMSPSKSPSA